MTLLLLLLFFNSHAFLFSLYFNKKNMLNDVQLYFFILYMFCVYFFVRYNSIKIIQKKIYIYIFFCTVKKINIKNQKKSKKLFKNILIKREKMKEKTNII